MSVISIVLAEDHLITRQGICRLLESDEHLKVVGEAGNGEEAVAIVAEKKPDVVIMDIAMPVLNGIEATRQIKQIYPKTAILILTAYDDDEYVFGLLEAGAAGYLLKTVGGDELIRAILAVYKGEPVLAPLIARKVIDHVKMKGKTKQASKTSEHLSEREMQVLKLASNGLSNKDIAEQLHLSRRTIEGTLRGIFNKLGVGSRMEAVLYALRKGWFSLEEFS